MKDGALPAPDFVGREVELERLRKLLDEAMLGNGSTIFISGEAGIGKTRLTNEIIKLGEKEGARVLRGWCLADSLEPLMPMRTAFRDAGLSHLFTGEKPPKLLSLYLMDGAGMLISKAEKEVSGIEPDIFAGMLTAVSNFVKDSLAGLKSQGQGKGLNVMGYENYRILLEYSDNCSLAAVISGKENEFLIDDIKQALARVERDYSKILENWSGCVSDVAGTGDILQELMNIGKYEGKFLVDDPRILQENLFDNLLLGIQRLSRERPVILFLDDLHWCDPTSLNLLHYLSRNIRENRALILGTYRPEDVIELEDGRPHQLEKTMQNMSREDLFGRIEISRLDSRNTEILIGNVLRPNDLEPEFFSKIHKETEGTPFYILEVIKLFVEEGCLEQEGGRWKLVTEIGGLAIPSKIYDVVKRRLDRLAKDQREILETASVIGEEFDSGIIGQVLGVNRIQLLKNLSEIEKTHRLIHSSQSKYHFDHAKVREVLYNGIIEELRQEYHRMVGDNILEHNLDNLDDFTGELAFHYHRARDSRAGEYLVKAGDMAKAKFANEEALQSYHNALGYIYDEGSMIEVFESMADIYNHVSEYEKSIEFYTLAIEAEKDAKRKASLHSKISLVYDQIGLYEKSVEECEKGLALVEDKDSIETGRLLNALSWTWLKIGDYNKVDEYMARSLEIARRGLDKGDIAQALQGMGTIYKSMGHLDSAEKYLQDAQLLNEEMDDILGLSSTFNNLGLVHQHKGELDKALKYYNMSRDMFRKIGKKRDIAVALINIGNTYIDLGELDEALANHEEGLMINRAIGARSSVAHSMTCIGYVYYEMGEYAKVIEIEEESNKMCSEMGYKTLMIYNYYNMGEAELGLGNTSAALKNAGKAIAMSNETAFTMGESMGRRLKGMAHRENREWDKAVPELENALEILLNKGDKRDLARTRYEYGLLYLAKNETEEARRLLNEALEEFRQMGMKLWENRTRSALEKTK